MNKIQICNWREYQHYKDRCPPWIKLHSNLLNSQMWVMLDDSSRLLAIALMVLASKHNNEIPADVEFIKKVAHLKKVDFKPLIDIEFCKLLADASEVLADASALLSSPLLSSDSSQEPDEGMVEVKETAFDKFWKAYPKKIGKGAARRVWQKVKPPIAECLKAIAWQARSDAWRKDDGQFIPHPTTWLNQSRWEDEPETAQEKGSYGNPQAKFNSAYHSSVAALRDIQEKFQGDAEQLKGVFKELCEKHGDVKSAVTKAWSEVTA